MRKAGIIITIISAMLLSGCGNSGKEEQPLDISGQWELMDIMATKAAQIGGQQVEVFIEFDSDNTFRMWQKLGEGRHRKYSGTWTLTEDILTGKYSDGKNWGSSYQVSVTGGNLYMSEQAQTLETYVYRPCTLPSGLN